MLIGFSFENFMSFYEENVFTMSASSDTTFKELNTIETTYGELIKSAFIFGANGSGKTNFIKALNWMMNFVLGATNIQSGMISQIPCFGFNTIAKKKPTTFEIQFIFNDVFYEYGFEILNGEIDKEYLRRKKNKRLTSVFERKSPDFNDISFTGTIMDNVKDLAKNTRRDNLFLYWANAGNNEVAINVYQWFANIQMFEMNDAKGMLTHTITYLEQTVDGKEKILNLLNKADINILGFDVETTQLPAMKGVHMKTQRKLYGEDWEEVGSLSAHIDFESSGTKKMFEVAGPIIDALEKGKVIFIDEIDSRLHPLLVRFLVMLFNSISNNPQNAQLICSTHDVLLLDEDIRRDQIYFTEKNEYGVSELYALTDFKGIRKNCKLLKQYLVGTFGATPNIRQHLIATSKQEGFDGSE